MKILGVFFVFAVLCVSTAVADAQTEQEVEQTIRDGYAYLVANLKDQPDAYSKDGAIEFWSSGGLMQEIGASGRPGEWDSFNLAPKHIRVLTLVPGQAAVAHFYSEGSMKPKGYPAVNHYLTRVTQVYVKESGGWKVRSSHWSPVAGGSGTSQTAAAGEQPEEE